MAEASEAKNMDAAMKLGSAYGKSLKNRICPNTPGHCLAGFAKTPPMVGPNTDPTDQTMGMMENAAGCSSFQGTISATIVLMMPTLPLLTPDTMRTAIAIGRLVDRPQRMKVTIVEKRPKTTAGLRPKWSEAAPQGMPQNDCESEKEAMQMPAQRPTSSFLTPKDSIISGR